MNFHFSCPAPPAYRQTGCNKGPEEKVWKCSSSFSPHWAVSLCSSIKQIKQIYSSLSLKQNIAVLSLTKQCTEVNFYRPSLTWSKQDCLYHASLIFMIHSYRVLTLLKICWIHFTATLEFPSQTWNIINERRSSAEEFSNYKYWELGAGVDQMSPRREPAPGKLFRNF